MRGREWGEEFVSANTAFHMSEYGFKAQKRGKKHLSVNIGYWYTISSSVWI